jgi:hypothetical protein
MKIGMMSLWNAANGPSIHAELVGRAWVALGHHIRVFSSLRHPDARPTGQRDESFVIRHFDVAEVTPVTRASHFDPSPLLDEEYEVFVAQNVERLPAEKLLQVSPRIKEKAVTVQIAHEGKAPEDPLYYRLDWDAIVCFDQRYREYLIRHFPAERIHMIPYPCHPLWQGDKDEARRKLGLPLDKRVLFSFGFRPQDITPLLPALRDIAKEHPVTYVINSNPESDVRQLHELTKDYNFVDLRVRPLPLDELYTYLHASDALLVHRESSRKYSAVVSSSVCLVLGSGCPILFHDSNFVETHGEEIIKYKDMDDLKANLVNLFDNGFDTGKVEAFLNERSADKIARSFLQLFDRLLDARKKEAT